MLSCATRTSLAPFYPTLSRKVSTNSETSLMTKMSSPALYDLHQTLASSMHSILETVSDTTLPFKPGEGFEDGLLCYHTFSITQQCPIEKEPRFDDHLVISDCRSHTQFQTGIVYPNGVVPFFLRRQAHQILDSIPQERRQAASDVFSAAYSLKELTLLEAQNLPDTFFFRIMRPDLRERFDSFETQPK